jgi:hypothetical protein
VRVRVGDIGTARKRPHVGPRLNFVPTRLLRLRPSHTPSHFPFSLPCDGEAATYVLCGPEPRWAETRLSRIDSK